MAMRVVQLGRCAYAGIEQRMRDFTEGRDASTEDELWLAEHEPVFTQGVAGRPDHVLAPAPCRAPLASSANSFARQQKYLLRLPRP